MSPLTLRKEWHKNHRDNTLKLFFSFAQVQAAALGLEPQFFISRAPARLADPHY